MAFRIDPTRATASEVRRVLRSELRHAAEDLETDVPPSADAVHDARKRLKKARSVLRLAVGDLTGQTVRDANGQLRDVARSLSGQRDADAVDETLSRLYAAAGEPDLRRVVESVRVELRSRPNRMAAADVLDAAGAADRIRSVRHDLSTSAPQADGWDALEPGFGRAYQRARKACERLGDAPSDETLHEWRKRSKDVWYHQRLLSGLWPDVQEPVVQAAADLADRLGDDHDLAVLRPLLKDIDPDVVEPVTELVERERERLLAEARRLGARLFADAPDAWLARHRTWWRLASACRPG